MRRPHSRTRRGAPAPDAAILCALLQRNQNAPIVERRCATHTPGSAERTHRVACHGRRATSPICSNLSFRHTQRLFALCWSASGAKIRPTGWCYSGHGGQQRFVGRTMKSPREVLIRPIALSLAAILLTTVLVAEAYSHATALHIRDPEDLALAFLLPTIFVAVFFGSTFAVASSFLCGLPAAYVIYPPQASIWIHDPTHIAELGFIVLLAITASKAVGVIIDGKPLRSSGSRTASWRIWLTRRPENFLGGDPDLPDQRHQAALMVRGPLRRFAEQAGPRPSRILFNRVRSL